MRKLLFALLFVFSLMLALPTTTFAEDGTGTTLRHSYRPFTNTVNNAMRARVDNFTPTQQKRLVCVEAWNNASGARNHLGCLWVDLAPMNSTVANWASEFEAPTYWLKRGTYTVVYTYQDEMGNWNRIRSTTLQKLDGTYTAP